MRYSGKQFINHKATHTLLNCVKPGNWRLISSSPDRSVMHYFWDLDLGFDSCTVRSWSKALGNFWKPCKVEYCIFSVMYHFSIFDQFSKLICGFFHFLISIGTHVFLPVVNYQLFSSNDNSQLSQLRRRPYMSSIIKLVIGSFWRQQEINLIAILFMPFILYLLCHFRT